VKAIGIPLSLVFVSALSTAALAAGPGVSDHQISDLIARIMNFAVMGGVLFFVLRKPVGQALGKRSKDIAEELADLEAQRDQARKEYAEMERRLKDAESEREKILQGFQKSGREGKGPNNRKCQRHGRAH
jgi:F-type H+-transporting ATPase subunit b